MTVVGTIYKTKSGRLFLVQEVLLPKKKGHYKIYTYDELNSIDDFSFKKDGKSGYEKMKGEVIKTIKENY